ncbi:MAG: hypothetical protein J6S71_06610, partial [Clostridia bacterium]|nr:hypothetical protein [Clostridia bacterium]
QSAQTELIQYPMFAEYRNSLQAPLAFPSGERGPRGAVNEENTVRTELNQENVKIKKENFRRSAEILLHFPRSGNYHSRLRDHHSREA